MEQVRIERLRDEQEYKKFEISQFFNAYFAVLAALLTLYVGVFAMLDDIVIKTWFAIGSIILIILATALLGLPIKNRIHDIAQNHLKLDELYEKLLKEK